MQFKRVHEAGIVTNDVSISNVILDTQDKMTLIDFGFAGRIREEVLSFFPPWKSRRAHFLVEIDNEAFDEVCNLCKEGTLQIPSPSQATIKAYFCFEEVTILLASSLDSPSHRTLHSWTPPRFTTWVHTHLLIS